MILQFLKLPLTEYYPVWFQKFILNKDDLLNFLDKNNKIKYFKDKVPTENSE
jgi:hypothetical protein